MPKRFISARRASWKTSNQEICDNELKCIKEMIYSACKVGVTSIIVFRDMVIEDKTWEALINNGYEVVEFETPSTPELRALDLLHISWER